MPAPILRFRALIEIAGINPFVRVSAVRADGEAVQAKGGVPRPVAAGAEVGVAMGGRFLACLWLPARLGGRIVWCG